MLKFLVASFLALLLAYPSMAAAQTTYCLSRVGSPKPKEQPSPESDALTTLGFRLQNASYQVVGVDDWLQYYRSNYIVSQVQAPQFMNLDDYPRSYKRIKDLKLDRYNWLWIDGAKIDYIAPLTFPSGVLTLGKPVTVSQLMSRPCSYLENLIFGCPPAQSSYSTTLKQVFLTGYEVNLFGTSSPQTYTIINGKLTSLPILNELQVGQFYHEVPVANGVIFHVRHQKAIFYDGQRVTTLLSKNLGWRLRQTPDGKRTFLVKLMISPASLVLQELTPGPRLTPIPASLTPTDFTFDIDFFTLPKDTTLWAIFKDGLFAQVNGRLQKVFTFSKPMSFDDLESVWQTPDGAIGFNLKDLKSSLRGSEGGTNYFLRRRSATTNCQIPISVGGR
jgi:hypothetical protein